MKKIFVCLMLVVFMIVLTACGNSKTASDDGNTLASTTTSGTTTTTQAYGGYEEEMEHHYYHAAIQGCVIEEQDGTDEVHYREKCEACGYVSSSTHTIWHSFGTYTSSFHCPQCQNLQRVEIESNEN